MKIEGWELYLGDEKTYEVGDRFVDTKGIKMVSISDADGEYLVLYGDNGMVRVRLPYKYKIDISENQK